MSAGSDQTHSDLMVGVAVAQAIATACARLSRLALPDEVVRPQAAEFDQFLERWASEVDEVVGLIRQTNATLQARFKEIEEGGA